MLFRKLAGSIVPVVLSMSHHFIFNPISAYGRVETKQAIGDKTISSSNFIPKARKIIEIATLYELTTNKFSVLNLFLNSDSNCLVYSPYASLPDFNIVCNSGNSGINGLNKAIIYFTNPALYN